MGVRVHREAFEGKLEWDNERRLSLSSVRYEILTLHAHGWALSYAKISKREMRPRRADRNEVM